MLTRSEQNMLLALARATIESGVHNKVHREDVPDIPLFRERRAVFVTLTLHGRLRGCIGQMTATESLWDAVTHMAYSAAFRDPRFSPLTEQELPDVAIEISILSPMRRINSWKEIVLGRDGVHVSNGFSSGVFLPQVAEETGWDRETFLRHLCADKAGLSPDCYKNPQTIISVFQVFVFRED